MTRPRGGLQPQAVLHALRFRQVSTLYPRLVALAYGGDLGAAMADDDGQVSERVAGWERRQGLEPRDWYALGREERDAMDGDAS